MDFFYATGGIPVFQHVSLSSVFDYLKLGYFRQLRVFRISNLFWPKNIHSQQKLFDFDLKAVVFLFMYIFEALCS